MSYSSLLVANRGEIARRILRGARLRGLRTVAVFVDADQDAPFVHEADESRRLATSYLDVDALVEAAAASGAEAVHPGYGFLAESAEFAARVEGAGLIWVGPSATVIAALGDKVEAKRLAIEAGVPTLPATEDSAKADEVGFPLLVKAAAGGGGKGMRIVERAEDLDEALAAARREARSAFGDDRVFLERYVRRARHVEVQILGDRYGALVHLGERDCSVQRRHQKLIEESPSPAVDDATRAALGAAALALAGSVGYQSAGTVEFLLDDETGEFYFLEVNTRLQVEHPVTEAVTGVDLVGEQLRLAAGEPLGYDQSMISFHGHAIEARLCAEDPEAGFLPATGHLRVFEPAAEPGVRVDSGVAAGTLVSVAFDPLLAKFIAHAPTRAEAASRLARALERLHLGGVVTNRDFLAGVLREAHFLAGEATTDYLERFGLPPSRLSDDDVRFAACAGALWLQGERRAQARVLASLPSGWRNARLPHQLVTLRHHEHVIEVRYQARRDGTFDLAEQGEARVHALDARSIDVSVNARRSSLRVSHVDDALDVQVPQGTVSFVIVERFESPETIEVAGGLHAPMPGVILDVRVKEGERVEAGQTLVIMEAMKMEHVISAPHGGVVREVLTARGQQVDRGVGLLRLDRAEIEAEA